MTTRTIEIRAAEGGEDARQFVAELATVYLRASEREGWKACVDRTPDMRLGNQTLLLEINGQGAEILDGESGGHRIQRIPNSEKRGRVHSSTVTVAVLCAQDKPANTTIWMQREVGDFSCTWFSGTGCGGQYRNKHMNSARIVHLPTATTQCAQTRSRENSYQAAMTSLVAELDRQSVLAGGAAINGTRRNQVGSGQRSDKRRTWRFQEGRIHDHMTGRSARVEQVMRGELRLLWQ